jgi:hypothetical protein
VDLLTAGPQRFVAGEAFEDQPLGELERIVEERTNQARGRADQNAADQRSAEKLELERFRRSTEHPPQLAKADARAVWWWSFVR